MKACFFAERQVGIGSMAAVLERYARAQSEFDVTWCDVTYHEPGGVIERLPLVPAGLRGPLRALAQIQKALREGPFDALFFLTQNPAVLRQDVLTGTPAVIWTDVTPVQLDALASAYNHDVTRFAPVRALKTAAVARALRLAARCVGWSEWTRRSFVSDYGVAESRTAVVPPAVDVSFWDTPARALPTGRPFRFVFVGGHFERKGGKVLLDVFRERLRGRCELDIATRDPVPEEPGVRVHRGLTAGSTGLRDLLRSADAFVLPTLADCHSVASLEAMAASLPVVLTNIGAGAEIVLEGESGFLVPPGDAHALGVALEALASDPARAAAMGARGRRIAGERFDASGMGAKLFAQLRHAAESKRP